MRLLNLASMTTMIASRLLACLLVLSLGACGWVFYTLVIWRCGLEGIFSRLDGRTGLNLWMVHGRFGVVFFFRYTSSNVYIY